MPIREFAAGRAFRVYTYVTERGRSPVDEYLEQLDVSARRRLLTRITLAMEHGPPRNEQQSRKLTGEEFFEFKAGSERLFWCYGRRRTLVLLHGFTKKRQKTSPLDLEIGRERYRAVARELRTGDGDD